MGIDVAWCGGHTGRSKANTRCECIAFTTRVNGVWDRLEIQRIDLNGTYNPKAGPTEPNSDPEAVTLLDGIAKLISNYTDVHRRVVALDVPCLAMDYGLPTPEKAPKREEGDEKQKCFRQCDDLWKVALGKSPRGWRHFKVLPGAPLYPRVTNLITGLGRLGFLLYGHCPTEETVNLLIECFPNEVIWSTGIVKTVRTGLNGWVMQLYKRLGEKRCLEMPADIFEGLWRHTLQAAFKATQLPDDTVDSWLQSFRDWLILDGTLNKNTGHGVTGKKFDDAVDSVLSLTAAVAMVQGVAHVHQGDPDDGHIIGPGLMEVL
jgi:hypothetical protein